MGGGYDDPTLHFWFTNKLAAEGQIISFVGSLEQRIFGDQNMLPAVHGSKWLDYGRSGGFTGECKRLNFQCEVLENWPQGRRWRILTLDKISDLTSVRLPAFAYPTWNVIVNGTAQERLADPVTGAIVAQLTAMDNLVELRWTPLPEERLGWTISFIATVLLFVLASISAAVRIRRIQPMKTWT